MAGNKLRTTTQLSNLASVTGGADTIPILNGSGELAPGITPNHVVQFVSVQDGNLATTTSYTIPNDDTIPQNSEGLEVMTLAITPFNANNTLIIDVGVNGTDNTNTNSLFAALFQDSIANALAISGAFADNAATNNSVSVKHVMTAGTTSATTFKVRIGKAQSSGTISFNGINAGRVWGGTASSFITITEIAA